jgi:hypothetical protein
VSDLFVVLKATMPQDQPGSLSDDQYAAVIAFLLNKNGVPQGQTMLKPDLDALKQLTFRKP